MTGNSFKRLEVAGWRQFGRVQIDFHPRLTVITGANGAGKSTLISLLSRQVGWSREYLAVPRRGKDGALSYLSGFVRKMMGQQSNVAPPLEKIGSITFGDGSVSSIKIQQSGSYQVGLTIDPGKNLDGLLIDSHRPSPTYSAVSQIPLQPMTAQQSFQNYNSEMLNRYNGAWTGSSPVFRMKESLISMGIFGEGNRTLGGSNASIQDTFDGFNEVLRKLLPPTLGFKELAIRSPEVVMHTTSGDFMLDASSGGIMTILDVAWRIHMFSKNKDDFIVLMDEPENHLHPSMQRTLMRRLLTAFPRAQFIIATHSPFMVSSVRDSSVYVLRYDQDGLETEFGLAPNARVFGQDLSDANMAANAGEVLREVLGVSATMPEWVEEELDRIVERYKGKTLSSQMLDNLRGDLSKLGYDDYYVDALGRLTA